MKKSIIRRERAVHTHMVGDGFRVSQLLPGYGREMTAETSPFLMLDYNAPWQIPPQGNHRPGVGFHPHRGFETVTIVYDGMIEHQDTAGNGGVIMQDEVQWMTAGSGLLHNEFMTEEFARSGGVQHIAQLWINLPKAHKMTSPRYQALSRDMIPQVSFENGTIRVIAGNYQGVQGPAKTFSPIELYDVRFDVSGEREFIFSDGYNVMILVTQGSVQIDATDFFQGEMVYLSRPGSEIVIWSSGSARILVMAGEPFDDPVVNYGPFVMNTEEEIVQAFADLREGKMGKISESDFS